MIEAMACGTPVIVMNHGSAPEVVKHGKTGFVVNSLIEMMESVAKISNIDRTACRRHVLEKFDAPRLATDYLVAYEQVIRSNSVSLV